MGSAARRAQSPLCSQWEVVLPGGVCFFSVKEELEWLLESVESVGAHSVTGSGSCCPGSCLTPGALFAGLRACPDRALLPSAPVILLSGERGPGGWAWVCARFAGSLCASPPWPQSPHLSSRGGHACLTCSAESVQEREMSPVYWQRLFKGSGWPQGVSGPRAAQAQWCLRWGTPSLTPVLQGFEITVGAMPVKPWVPPERSALWPEGLFPSPPSLWPVHSGGGGAPSLSSSRAVALYRAWGCG